MREKNGVAWRQPQSDRGDRRRAHPDENLVRLRQRRLDLLDPQHLRPSVPVVDDRPHRLPRPCSGGWGCRIGPCPHPPRPVELGRLAAARAGPGAAPGRDHPARLGQQAPAEVRAVELHAPDGLVHRPQLGEGERRPDEGRGEAPEREVDADALDRVAHDPLVVERQLELAVQHVGDREPARRPPHPCPRRRGPTAGTTARYATVTTFIRGSRPGSP